MAKTFFKWNGDVADINEEYGYSGSQRYIGMVVKTKKTLTAHVNLGDDVKIVTTDKGAKALKQLVLEARYAYQSELITVYSIFDTKRERPIEIARYDVGSACDPSTERYHSM